MDEQAKIQVLVKLGLTEDAARVIFEDAPRPDTFGVKPDSGDEVIAGTYTATNCFALMQRDGTLAVTSMLDPRSEGLRAELEDAVKSAERRVRSLKAMLHVTDALGGGITAIDPVDEEALAHVILGPEMEATANGGIWVPGSLRLTEDEKEVRRLHFSKIFNERIEDVLAASPVFHQGWECDHTVLVLKMRDGSLKAHVVAGTGPSRDVGQLLRDSIEHVSDGLPKMRAMLDLVGRIGATENEDDDE